MPVSPPDGGPLGGGARLSVLGVNPFPPISMPEAYVWVLNGPDVWSSEARFIDSVDYVDVVVDGGPLWGPGITVDMVLGIRSDRGRLHLVLCRNVLIVRTE